MRKPMKVILTLSIIAVALLTALFISVNERSQEGEQLRMAQQPNLEVSDTKLSQWREVYPYQTSSYLEAFKPSSSSKVLIDELKDDPRLVVLWAGYGFSKDYNRPRGHGFAVVDILNTLRTGAPKDAKDGPMPATCWSCKSPDVPKIMQSEGIEEFYSGTWARHGADIVNPIGCPDCHDPQTGNLQISRPALLEVMQRQGIELSSVTHQQMRSLVCAQCHVEYYFEKPNNYLRFPWDKGMSVEAIESYYDAIEFSDWTHKISKAPMLKAQHPGYELFQQGIHAQRGVACADCHMPYKVEGGRKYSDHHVQSPRYNIAGACQQCHRQSETELITSIDRFKAKILEIKILVEEELVKAHFEAQAAWQLGADPSQMSKPLQDIRHAQWRWDFGVASHGSFFHAPEESLRVLAVALHKASAARRELAILIQALDPNYTVSFPDISSKEKAQKVIGIHIEELESAKKDFLNSFAKEWWLNNDQLDPLVRQATEGELRR